MDQNELIEHSQPDRLSSRKERRLVFADASNGPAERRRAQVRRAQKRYREKLAKRNKSSSIEQRLLNLEKTVRGLSGTLSEVERLLESVQHREPDTDAIYDGHSVRSRKYLRLAASEQESVRESSPQDASFRPFECEPEFSCLGQWACTYSVQELTFARRLQRGSYEYAFRLLSRTDPPLTVLKRIFRHTHIYSNRSRMLERLVALMRRSTRETLENWDAPFLNIGGAGLHYPHRDGTGNQLFAPYKGSNLLQSSSLHQQDVFVRTAELEGDWFDSNDVEEYLRERGVVLDGFSTSVSLWLEGPRLVGSESLEVSAIHTGLDQVLARTLLTVDVEKMISYLLETMVCLGRCPGFRRSEIDHALRLSVSQNHLGFGIQAPS